jgi:bifunctional DNA-binding transcriptional regulator/antitoxin component of YhaV-PrlF toxin-antitoxin module
MADVMFDSKLEDDGTLVVPKQAVEELGIHPGDRVRVHIHGSSIRIRARPTLLSLATDAMTNRSPMQIADAQAQAMETYQPRRAVPHGKTLADVVSGQWPGEETDEQIDAALLELS